ncbi:hypothetical protein OUZ56_023915 [Daphnia magna]|uniref:Uncharacterized protein n=1 Tax=Daphnia magna TaxID=35525 RepID=A0ABR0AZT7_9CRUS|nr:hypothetical protein OUZ56_023915 [Daphnia magna]
MLASVSSRHKRRRIQKKLVTDSAFYEEDAEKHSSATESVTVHLRLLKVTCLGRLWDGTVLSGQCHYGQGICYTNQLRGIYSSSSRHRFDLAGIYQITIVVMDLVF